MDSPADKASGSYDKKDNPIREDLWRAMEPMFGEFKPNQDPEDDDEFDAYVVYFLGSKWLANSSVMFLGSLAGGSFLVPDIEGTLASIRRIFRVISSTSPILIMFRKQPLVNTGNKGAWVNAVPHSVRTI